MNRRSKTLVLAGSLAAAVAALSASAQAAGMDTNMRTDTGTRMTSCDGMKHCRAEAMKPDCMSAGMARTGGKAGMENMDRTSDTKAQCADATMPHHTGSNTPMKEPN